MEPVDRNIDSIESGKNVVGAWVGTLLYCAVSFGFFYYSLVHIRHPIFDLVTGFFAAWGVVYLGWTLWVTLGVRKFGDLRLLLERPLPAVGGSFVATLGLPPAALAARTIHAELSCWKMTSTIKGDSEEPHWATAANFPVRRKADGRCAATLSIESPPDLEPSRTPPPAETLHADDPPRIYWLYELRVTADVPGVDLARTFPVQILPRAQGTVAAAKREAPPRLATPAMRAAPAPAVARPEPLPAAAKPAPAIPAVASVAATAVAGSGEKEEPADTFSVWALVAANLVPLVGVAAWGWRVQDVVFLYWIENFVIGAFNVLRILFADPDTSELERRGFELGGAEKLAGKLALAAFFVVHYGGFCYVHGEILMSFFPGEAPGASLWTTVRGVLGETGMYIAVAAITASHAYSLLRNYIGRREYCGVELAELMTRPYKRIFVTHVFIIAGGALISGLRMQVPAMLLFIALKVGFDVFFHRQERKALGA